MGILRMGLAALLAALLTGLGCGGAAAQDPAEAARGAAVFDRLGCASCHGAPGAGGTSRGADLVRSALPRLADGGATLAAFMSDAAKGHPDLNGRPALGQPPIARVSREQAADLVALLRAEWDAVRARLGQGEGPAVAAAAEDPCRVTDALYTPINTERRANPRTDAYELACEGALGRVIIRSLADGKATYEVRDCLTTAAPGADGRPGLLACALPANRDLPAQLGPYLSRAGVACVAEQARAIGSAPTVTQFEVVCAGGRAYVLGVAPTLDPRGEATARNCLAYAPGMAVECRLRPREALLASATDGLIDRASPGCAAKARRYVATSRGEEYYEIACAAGIGFMAIADTRGGYKGVVACDAAQAIADGCVLTDLRAAQTTDAARHTALAKASAFDCAVSGYRPVAVTAQEATVELACGNRPDGAIAQIASGAPSAYSRLFNCAAAETLGYRCTLTRPEAAHGALTAALKRAIPGSTCQVSASQFLGVTPEAGFVEVACADAAPGYVLLYAKANGQPTEALYCSRMRAQLGVTCGLPTNTVK